MAEIESNGLKKQLLSVSPSRLALYSGLSADESPSPGAKNPFAFLELGFAYPALALHQAYPSGAGAVPEARTQTEVVLENKHPGKLTTVRTSTHRVQFQLALQSKAMTIDGIWDGNLHDPLPNAFPLAAWVYDSPAVVTTLGEARSLPIKAAPGK